MTCADPSPENVGEPRSPPRAWVGPPPAGAGRGAGSSTAEHRVGQEESSNPDGQMDIGRPPGAPASAWLAGARGPPSRMSRPTPCFSVSPCVTSNKTLF